MISIKKTTLILLTAGLMVTSCKKKETPIGTPSISTAAVTNIIADKATSGGNISYDGGAAVTASGICWSKTNATPTTADSKVEGTTTSGVFTAELTGLTPSSTYYVRAYAINSAGIGYGNVVTFSTGNAGPTVTALTITGDTKVNATLTAAYTYSDAEGDLESGTTYKWYVANDAAGTGEAAIAGATAKTYVVQTTEQGKYIRVGVTAKAATGTLTGIEIKSPFIGGIGEATTVSFTYNGVLVTYGILTSAKTGRKWLDRNLGAGAVPLKVDDYANYGDLFQWGRLADGHQLTTRTGPNDTDVSGMHGTTTLDLFNPSYSTTDVPPNSLFIANAGGAGTNDWRNPKNDNLWKGVSGINNPCPSGWRPATKDEWVAENIVDLADGFNKLKLTYTGVRSGGGDGFFQSTTAGIYWTSSVGGANPDWSIRIRLNPSFTTSDSPRTNGLACRCIKD
ncbi:MAG TPA: hypothetical protein VKB19_17835 [Pedobacter sp.]|nr:hypothetical protein [Pedobacter sp.]